jgi:hypothetical protein
VCPKAGQPKLVGVQRDHYFMENLLEQTANEVASLANFVFVVASLILAGLVGA